MRAIIEASESTREEVRGQEFIDLSKEEFIKKYGTLRYDSMQYLFYANADDEYNNHV